MVPRLDTVPDVVPQTSDVAPGTLPMDCRYATADADGQRGMEGRQLSRQLITQQWSRQRQWSSPAGRHMPDTIPHPSSAAALTVHVE